MKTLEDRAQGIMTELEISGGIESLHQTGIDMAKVFVAGGKYVIEMIELSMKDTDNPIAGVINTIKELRGEELLLEQEGKKYWSSIVEYEGNGKYILKYKKHWWSKWRQKGIEDLN